MLDMRQLTKELIESGWQHGEVETAADDAVLKAIRNQDHDLDDRKRSVVDWLKRYKVLMGWPAANRLATAGRIIAFAYERQQESLHLDRDTFALEFEK